MFPGSSTVQGYQKTHERSHCVVTENSFMKLCYNPTGGSRTRTIEAGEVVRSVTLSLITHQQVHNLLHVYRGSRGST